MHILLSIAKNRKRLRKIDHFPRRFPRSFSLRAVAQCSRWAFFIYLRSMRKKNSNQIFFGGLYDVLFILDENVMFSLCPRYEKNKIVKVNKMFAQIQTKWT